MYLEISVIQLSTRLRKEFGLCIHEGFVLAYIIISREIIKKLKKRYLERSSIMEIRDMLASSSTSSGPLMARTWLLVYFILQALLLEGK
jgi:hypothetical protein